MDKEQETTEHPYIGLGEVEPLLEDPELAEDQLKNSKVPKQLQPWMYKKGQSGNPAGRPKGISLKEYAKMKFLHMTDEEREEFFEGLSKDKIWEMAEGKPKQDTENKYISDPIPVLVQFIDGKDDKDTNT